MNIKRGDIYFTNLGPYDGSEQGGERPVLILQNDVGNEHSPTVIIAAITDISKRYMPTHVGFTAAESGLEKDSWVLLEQIRTLDKRKLEGKVGRLTPKRMELVDKAMMISLGLVPAPAPKRKGECK
ncbi:type II toxin-antitoxin system PemK/MazF family toxin [Paenibacillus pinihumi]|uniref:type II toxin-antitoxin system PemK/MazF family toxin n=1 Tax=Paenibacillus pinihumi TaxID=669462 RepID=UPI00048C6716|nr:type II toxin-antitoxin system PemK/MazF family toxin [Paenibacillus pinihumi]